MCERYKAEIEERIERRQWRAPTKKVKSEKYLRDIRGIEGRDRNENVFARPDRLHEISETAISCRGS